MFAKILLIAAALAIVGVHGKPGVLAPVAYSAPLLAASPAVVTAQSSQYIARNYNGIAPLAAYTAAGVAPLAYSAPLTAAYRAAAPFAYSSPLAYSAPLAAAAAYAAPVLL